MQGLMMDYPLTLQHAFDRAVRIFHRKEIVTRTDTGLHRLRGVPEEWRLYRVDSIARKH